MEDNTIVVNVKLLTDTIERAAQAETTLCLIKNAISSGLSGEDIEKILTGITKQNIPEQNEPEQSIPEPVDKGGRKEGYDETNFPESVTIGGKQVDPGRVVTLARAKWSQQRIADEFGITQGQVSSLLKKMRGLGVSI